MGWLWGRVWDKRLKVLQQSPCHFSPWVIHLSLPANPHDPHLADKETEAGDDKGCTQSPRRSMRTQGSHSHHLAPKQAPGSIPPQSFLQAGLCSPACVLLEGSGSASFTPACLLCVFPSSRPRSPSTSFLWEAQLRHRFLGHLVA